MSLEIVYGTRWEVFKPNCGESLSRFITTTFGLDDVFQNKFVEGRYVGHGKRSSEPKVLLKNEKEANKFVSSRKPTESGIMFIYDNNGDSTSATENFESKDPNGNIVISREQWDDLVSKVKILEVAMKERERGKNQGSDAVYTHDGHKSCNPAENSGVDDTCDSSDHKFSSGVVEVNQPSDVIMLSPFKEAMQSTTNVVSANRQVVIDFGRDRQNLFSVLSNLESLDDIASGYKTYKKWTADHNDKKITEILEKASIKQRFECGHLQKLPTYDKSSFKMTGKLKVEMTREMSAENSRKDSVLVFKIHNKQEIAVPGGLTFVCYEMEHENNEIVTFDLKMESQGILPGNYEVLKIDTCRKAVRNNFTFKRGRGYDRTISHGLITLVDKEHSMQYRAFTRFSPGFSFTLEPVPAEGYKGKLTVDFYREYNVMLFHIHNGLSLPILSGFSFECRENEDNQVNRSCAMELGDSTIMPGYSRVFEYIIDDQNNDYGQMFTSKPSRGDVLIRDKYNDIRYKATTILQAGIHVILKPARRNIQQVGDLDLFQETTQPSDEDDSDSAISL